MPLTEFTRDSLTFDVRDEGTPTNGTILLLHGFPQSADSWDQVIPLLVAAGYRVLAPDQRGYSPRARPAGIRPYAIAELVDDVAALITAAGDGPVHVVGHDWGAAVAWSLAQRRPELLLSVTGVSVPPTAAFLAALHSPRQALASWYFAAFQLPGVADRLLDPGTARGRSQLTRRLVDAGQSQAHATRDVAALGSRAGLTAALGWYRAVRFALPEADVPIATPALFVWSTGDVAITATAAKLAGKHVAGSYHAVTLLGVSHWIPDEAPGPLAEAVLRHVTVHAP